VSITMSLGYNPSAKTVSLKLRFQDGQVYESALQMKILLPSLP
jgi:hypothetical protein